MSFYTAAYQRDTALHPYQSLEQYLYWVRKFYAGTSLYPRGWNAISEDLIAVAPDDELAAARRRQLYRLGRDISQEWAKANNVRLVDAGTLSVWGVATGRAVDEGNVDETLDRISADLQSLLREQLASDEIRESRYHAPDPDDLFAF